MTAKFNEGDIIEGIVCLGMGLYLAYERIDKIKLNKLRTMINPNKFIDGREKLFIVKNQKEGLDYVTVECIIRLKASSTSAAYGKDYKILYKSDKDVGNIEKKINVLISSITNTSFGKRILQLKYKYIKNNINENLYFTILADGIAGETSGGEIKGDIDVILEIKNSKNEKIGRETIPFSIKSGSKTASNLSPYRGMIKFADAFNINKKFLIDAKPGFEAPARSITEKEAINILIIELYDKLVDDIVKSSKKNSKTFNEYAIKFISKEIFGSDLADLVDIETNKIKEITMEYFDAINNIFFLEAIKIGNQMKIVDKNDNKKVLFSIRVKLRVSSSGTAERKFYIETGNLLYKK
jgi:hypothetical protein